MHAPIYIRSRHVVHAAALCVAAAVCCYTDVYCCVLLLMLCGWGEWWGEWCGDACYAEKILQSKAKSSCQKSEAQPVPEKMFQILTITKRFRKVLDCKHMAWILNSKWNPHIRRSEVAFNLTLQGPAPSPCFIQLQKARVSPLDKH